MDDVLIKQLLAAVAVITASVLISFMVYVARSENATMGDYFTRMSQVFTSATEPEFSHYAGKYVDGKTVRSVIEDGGGEYFFRIRTKTNALSFCVYEKPVDFLLNDGAGNYYDYTESGSLYYIDENDLYMTTVYRADGNGDVLGALFEQRGAGSISGTVSQLYQLTDLLEAKNKYLAELAEQDSTMNEVHISTAIASARDTVQTLQEEADRLLTENAGATLDAGKINSFNTSKVEIEEAAELLAATWDDYLKAFETETGMEAQGHWDITSNNVFDDPQDLQYWIRLFSGDIVESGDSGGS